MSAALTPVITNAGITALIDATNRGVKATISHVAVGNGGVDGPYVASVEMTELKNEIQRVIVAGGEMLGNLQNQLHLTATIQNRGDNVPEVYPIYEIGFFLDTGELFAIYASADEKLAEKVAGTDFVLAFDLTFTGAGAGEIVVDGSAELQMPMIARDNLLMGENTVKIHTQAEFDRVFNQGEDTEIPANTTIVLNPIQNVDSAAIAYNGRPAYVLNNSLAVRANVSIIGFNQEDTLVIKGDAEARIKIIGASAAPVTGVKFSGWSFDGRGGVNELGGSLISNENGGAIYLEHVEQCQFECKLINHQTQLAGGGIYAGEGVFQISANNVQQNLANEGGGVFGCHKSTLTVDNCQALAAGSGVFGCSHCEIRLFNCDADNCVEGIVYRNNDDATFNGKLTFSGDLTTNAIDRITPFKIRGTGRNRNAARSFKLGNDTVYSIADKKGLALTRIKRGDHSIIGETSYYDTSVETDCNALAMILLEEMSNDELGVLTSYETLGSYNKYLRSALKKLGLFQALSLSHVGAGGVPYAAIFEVNKSSAAGAGVVESVSSIDGDAHYAELNGWITDGSFIATGVSKNTLIGSHTSGSVLGAYVDYNGYVGIGTVSPVVPFTLLADEANHPVGITQNSYGDTSTMEFTTQDSRGKQATRLCLKGGADEVDIEFLRGALNSEDVSLFIKGENGHVGIGTNDPVVPFTLLAGEGNNPVGITQNNYGDGYAMEFTTQDGDGNQATRLCLSGGSHGADVEFLRGAQSQYSGLFIKGTNGHVGIGTNDPVVPFTLRASERQNPVGITQNSYGGSYTMELTTQDGGGNQATRICLRGGGDNSDIEFLRGGQGAENASMLIRGENGYVGIGENNPEYPLHVKGAANVATNGYGYLNRTHPVGKTNHTIVAPYSIYASHRIRAVEFNATSDARIKRITGKSASQSDLELLLKLQVTDYQYIDHHAYGDVSHKGLIAQQVDKVFPQAVQKTPDYIPDIYALSDQVNFNPETSALEIHLAQAVDLTVGDQVQLITEKSGQIDKPVIAISQDRHSFTLGEWEETVENVFVYGKKVNDFCTINYDRISMLCVSAVQVQQEQQQKLAKENKALTAKVEQMETDYNELKAEFIALKTMLLRDLNQR